MAIKARVEVFNEGERRIVRVAGWLSRDTVRMFEEALDSDSGALLLDLSELRFADKSALELIRLLRNTGVEVRGASPYITSLLGHAQEPRFLRPH